MLSSSDHGGTFAAVATDPWQAAACVMSTSAVAMTPRRSVAAWETGGQVVVADLARPGATVKVAGTDCKHPAVAVDAGGRSVVAWAEGTGWNRGGSVAWQAFDAAGVPIAGASGRADDLPVWDAPAVVATGDGKFTVLY